MRKRRFLFMARLGLLLCAALIVVGCSDDDYTPPPNACGALQDMTIPSVGTANGTKVTSATLVAAKDAAAGVEYCKVVGVIYPITTSETVTAGGVTTVVPTENITFNVALPTKWNLKAIQVGGGGFNGSVPAVDTASDQAAFKAPSPGAMRSWPATAATRMRRCPRRFGTPRR